MSEADAQVTWLTRRWMRGCLSRCPSLSGMRRQRCSQLQAHLSLLSLCVSRVTTLCVCVEAKAERRAEVAGQERAASEGFGKEGGQAEERANAKGGAGKQRRGHSGVGQLCRAALAGKFVTTGPLAPPLCARSAIDRLSSTQIVSRCYH
jgi:hypothetical protein